MVVTKPGTILTVDDNTRNLQLIGSVLQKNGYEVAMAMSGPEALEFLEQERPDLILLDIMMPDMDGFEVCRILKQRKQLSAIPIIFLTAKNDPEDIVEGFECGGVDYITKPFHTAELLARIKTHIELRRARKEIYDLKGMLPICACCKKIRDDQGLWHRVEEYISSHSQAEFTHTMCSSCRDKALDEVNTYKKSKSKE